MREILFRGKLVNYNGWVYGNRINDDIINRNCYLGRYAVIPETIGQFTGLCDKNSNKIFEGDICRFKRFNDIHVGKIVFNVKTASFVMWYQLIVGAYGEKATQKMLLSVCDDIEVIGNIHDSPELLENSSL